MKKRTLSLVLTLLMLVSVIPTNVVAATSGTPSAQAISDVMENTNQGDGVVLRKSVAPHLQNGQPDGTVDVTIEAYTTGEVRQTVTTVPTDIVLVLDMSGSMDKTVASYPWTYSTVNGSVNWDSGRLYYGYFNTGSTSRKYYVNVGSATAPDYREVTLMGSDSSRCYYYRYYGANNAAVYVYPRLNSYAGNVTREHDEYPVVQFYVGQASQNNAIYAIDALKTAVKAFIETTHEKNGEILEKGGTELHRIALVKFADDTYYNSANLLAVGNHKGAGGNSDYNYTELVANLTAVNEAGAAALSSTVNALDPGGATSVDLGLNVAAAVLNPTNTNSTTRNKAVIVFTDGEPNHSSGFDSGVANTAISIAHDLKFTGAKVYTISLAQGSNAADTTQNINKFLHYVSSNYPNATNMNTAGNNGDPTRGYYKTPSEDSSLTAIFEAIAQQIEAPTISLGSTAQIIDTMSTYFALPQGRNSITLQTADRIKNPDGTWGWTAPAAASGLSYTVSGKTVEVHGFNYDQNYVSEDPRTRGANTAYYGTKLIITINSTPDYAMIDTHAGSITNGNIPSNDSTANLLNSSGQRVAVVESPYISANTVTYQYIDPATNQPVVYARYYRLPGAAVAQSTAVPNLTGYSFNGWTTSDVTVSGGIFTMPQKNVVFTGTFTAKQYKVTYTITGYNPGAAAPSAQTGVPYGTNVTIAPDLYVAGYTFTGWTSTYPAIAAGDTGFSMPDHDVELIGYFTANSGIPYKTIHYTQNLDGTFSEKETVPGVGSTDQNVTAATRTYEGFTLDTSVPGTVSSGKITADGQFTMHQYHVRNKYKVTYLYDGSVPTGAPNPPADTVEYMHGATVTIKPHTAQDAVLNHTFAGWHSQDGTVSDSAVNFVMPIGGMTLYGEFSPKADVKFTVEHYLQNADGSYPTAANITDTAHGTAGTTVYAAAYQRSIAGYTYNASVAGSVTQGVISENPALVLKLYYTVNKYDVTYRYDGFVPADATPLTNYGSQDVTYNTAVQVQANATATGYTFSGWSISSPASTVIDEATGSFTMPASDVVLVGHFHANANTKYRIEYYWQNINNDNYALHEGHDRTGTTGQSVDIPVLTYDGFVLNESVSGTFKSGVIAADGSLVLRLYYDRMTYEVKYAYDGAAPTGAPAVPTDSKRYRYGEEVTVAGDLTLTNYDFIGWYSKVSGAVTPDTAKFTMPIPQNKQYVTLYGYFVNATDVPYIVNHYLEDPSAAGSIPRVYLSTPHQTVTLTGTAGDVVSDVTIAGYRLANIPGYEYDRYVATPNTQVIAQSPELVINLYYKLIPYTVTYEIEGTNPGVVIPAGYNSTEYYNATVTVKNPLECPGYTFSGWEIETPASTVINGTTFTMPADNVKLVGSFIPNTNTRFYVEHHWQNPNGSGYTLHEKIPYNGGVTGETVDVLTTHPNLIQDYTGLTFAPGTTGEILFGIVSGDPANPLVLKLYYNRNTYTVTYTYESSSPIQPQDKLPAPNPQTYLYGATVQVAADPSVEHYDFIGWYSHANVIVTEDMPSFVMPAANVTLYGDFERISGVPYRVEYYLQDGVNSTTYKEDKTAAENYTNGVAGETAYAVVKAFPGYIENTTHPGRKLSGTITADGALVLKVYYDLASYKVTYEYEGTLPANRSPLPAASTAVYQSNVQIAPNATADGYTFSGWTIKTPAGMTTSGGSFMMPAADVVLVGSFSVDPDYTVEYYLEQPDGSYVKDAASSHTHTAPAGQTVTAHVRHFDGYTENTSHPNRVPSGTVTASPKLTLKLYYDLIEYTVTYKYEGTLPQNPPTLPGVANKHYKDTETTPNPTVAGYIFSGWTSDQVGTVTPGGTFTMPAQNVVLKGQFIAGNADYVIEHYLMNEFGNYNNVVPHTETKTGIVGDSVRATSYQPYLDMGAKIDTKVMPTLGKWEGIVVASATQKLTLKLYYSREATAKVVYHYDGDLTPAQWQALGWPNLPVDSKQYYVGATVTALDVVGTKPANKTFEGWYSSDPTLQIAPNGTFTMPRLPDNHPVIHFYGRWVDNAPQNFTVRYFVDNVELPQYTKIYAVNTPVSVMAKLPNTTERTYSAWTLPVSATPGATVAFNPNGTFTMTAAGEVHIKCTSTLLPPPVVTYKVTYYMDGTQYWQHAYQVGQQHVILSAPPMALGQIFSGWSAPRTTSGAIVPIFALGNGQDYFTMPAADVVIYGTSSWMPILDGALRIRKVVDAPAGFTGSNVYTFNIYRLDDGVKTLVQTAYVAVNPLTGRGSSNLIELPKGSNYIVEEVGANVPGYSLETVLRNEFGAVIPEGQTIRVAMKVDPTEIVFTNTYAELPLETKDHFGYIIGYPDGTVRPEGNITRAEAATIFFRLLTDEKRAEYWSKTSPFTDVSPESWYNNAIATLANAGVLNGYEDNTFRPGNAITRAELVKIAMAFYGTTSSGGSGVFSDTDEHWASAFINAAAELGFISGYGDGTFQPDRLITRAEAMKIINRTLGRTPEKDHLLPDMITWSDNANPDVWYYAEVQEATNSHTYTDGDLHEVWERILPVRDWAALEKEWSTAYGGND